MRDQNSCWLRRSLRRISRGLEMRSNGFIGAELCRLISRWTALRRIGSSGLPAEKGMPQALPRVSFSPAKSTKIRDFFRCGGNGTDRPEVRRHFGGLGRAHQERRPARGPLESEGPPAGGGGVRDGGRD